MANEETQTAGDWLQQTSLRSLLFGFLCVYGVCAAMISGLIIYATFIVLIDEVIMPQITLPPGHGGMYMYALLLPWIGLGAWAVDVLLRPKFDATTDYGRRDVVLATLGVTLLLLSLYRLQLRVVGWI